MYAFDTRYGVYRFKWWYSKESIIYFIHKGIVSLAALQQALIDRSSTLNIKMQTCDFTGI